MKAVLYVSSDCPDTDIVCKLTQVLPNGQSINLTDGAVLAGKSLTANHLYLATADGQSVTAGAACTVLVLGGYEVK